MNCLVYIRLKSWLAIMCVFFGTTAYADLLVLKNGDRITGEITRIWDAEITIEPKYSDEFQVDLEAVSHIESDREFEVEFYDGRTIDAQLGGADAAGQQVFEAASGSVAAPLEAMLELTEPPEAFDWDSNVEVAANINRGNTDTSSGRVSADTTLKMNDHRHIGDVEFLREKQGQISTQERDLMRYSYNWLFGDPWFFTTDASYERDPIIRLDNRIIISAGIGYDVWDTPRRTLSIKLGAGYQTEESASITSDGSVLSWALRYRQDFFSDDFEFFHDQSIIENITGRSNTNLKTRTGLSYEITDLLSANISLDYNYVTDPAATAENADLALLFGFAAEF
jgi:putative salt-induced outer membrane protein YdiY